MDSLGKCKVCNREARVLYPLLPGSPAFCGEHHNPVYAEPFGCDFGDPDDFDIPIADDIYDTSFDRNTFTWMDRDGIGHPLDTIDDRYLQNIIGFLKRRGGSYSPRVTQFLKEEQVVRKAYGI